MGKKRIIQKSAQDILEERDKVDHKLKKEFMVKSPQMSRRGRIYIFSTYNNTIMSLTDSVGNVLFWRSAGNIGFKGTKKGTSFAASKVAQAITLACQKLRIEEVSVFVRGIGSGRDTALKTLVNYGLAIERIKDITPIPHNGCRARKPRRV